MSDEEIKVGDRVAWSSSGGKSVGRVKKKLTKPLDIKGHHVAASPENPELLVQSENGGEAAHKPGSVHKLSDTSSKPGSSGKSTKKGTAKKKTASKATPSKAAAKRSSGKFATKKSVGKKAATKK